MVTLSNGGVSVMTLDNIAASGMELSSPTAERQNGWGSMASMRGSAFGFKSLLTIDKRSALLMQQQLADQIKALILRGELKRGQRLPSTRSLSKQTGVSRAVIVMAYRQLFDEGYVESFTGSGSFVSRQLPTELLSAWSSESEVKEVQETLYQIPLSSCGSLLAQWQTSTLAGKTPQFDFTRGGIGADRGVTNDLLSFQPKTADRQDTAANLDARRPLSQAIAKYLTRTRGVKCRPEQVIVVSGSRQALDIIARVHVDRGDLVAMQDPGYVGAQFIFKSCGATLCGLPNDEEGVDVTQVSLASSKVRLAYLTPSHQFPDGSVISLQRRLEILDWAQAHGAIIIEDDYNCELRCENVPIRSLQGLDTQGQVIYMGNFSKLLYPALRIGYIVVPESLIEVYDRAKRLCDDELTAQEEQALATFIDRGYMEKQFQRMRDHYDLRRESLVASLSKYFGDKVEILGAQSGLHVVVWFDTKYDDERISALAEEAGVRVASLRSGYLNASPRRGEFIFSFGNLLPEEIDEAIARLAMALAATCEQR
jgi:GntR family transcriptional regulator/MocR family aminotransferase